jgi:hypothetical protein
LQLPRHAWDGEIAFFETSATWLALFPRGKLAEDAGVSPTGDGFSGLSLAHIVRTREGVDQLIDQARRLGANVTVPPEEKRWGGYSGVFRRPRRLSLGGGLESTFSA